MTEYTVLTVLDDDAASRMEAAFGALLPLADVRRVDVAAVGELPPAAAVVVPDAANARVARAAGFAGGIVVLGSPASADEASAFRAQGTWFVPLDAPLAELADALARAIPLGADGMPQAVHDGLFRARRHLAAGEIALTMQHDFNNPLAALMAEAQMLQMDAPNEDVRAAAGRMLGLVRRLTEMSRSLDAVRERKPSEGA